jgi:hypothetical protein
VRMERRICGKFVRGDCLGLTWMRKGREMTKQEPPIILFEMHILLWFCAALAYKVEPFLSMSW